MSNKVNLSSLTASLTQAFTTYTCRRCSRRESTSALINTEPGDRYMRVLPGPMPEGWGYINNDHVCQVCKAIVREVMAGAAVLPDVVKEWVQ